MVVLRSAMFSVLLLAMVHGTLVGCGSTTKSTKAELIRSEQAMDQRIALANLAKESGDYDEALQVFREILSSNPTAVPAYVGIGDVHLARQEYGMAEPAYARAVRFEPHNFDAQFGHGLSLQMLQRFQEALRAYSLALAIDPESAKTYRGMATVHLQLANAQNALPYAERAVNLEPDHGASRVNLGAVYDELARYPEAIDQYLAGLEIMEPNEPLMLNLIAALGKEERFEEAVNAGENLIRFSPTPTAYERLGWAYFRAGDFASSIDAYRKAIALDGDHWQSLNGVGVNALNTWLLSDRKDTAALYEARVALRRSLQINPKQMKIVTLMSHYGM